MHVVEHTDVAGHLGDVYMAQKLQGDFQDILGKNEKG